MTVLTKEQFLEEIAKLRREIITLHKSVLTLDECCAYTGFSKRYVQELMCRMEIPCYRPGGRYPFFKRSEIDTWLLRNKSMSASEIKTLSSNHLLNCKS